MTTDPARSEAGPAEDRADAQDIIAVYPPVPAAPLTWGGSPPAKPEAGRLSRGIAGIIAAAALVAGGSAGFVIGHSSSSTQRPPSIGQMGGYGTPPDLGQLGTA